MLREKNAHVLRVGGRGGGGEEKGFSFWDVASAEDSLPDGTGGAREPMCAVVVSCRCRSSRARWWARDRGWAAPSGSGWTGRLDCSSLLLAGQGWAGARSL